LFPVDRHLVDLRRPGNPYGPLFQRPLLRVQFLGLVAIVRLGVPFCIADSGFSSAQPP